MAKKIKFVRDVYRDGEKIHAIGDTHEQSNELGRHVLRGNAVEVDVEEEKKPEAKGKGKGKE